ncbi:MAG: VWA domain-containing protein, partial [Desulfovibrio sp.]
MLTTRFLTPSAQRATWVLLVLSALMACLLTILAPAPALAQDREPLLIEGKSSLYQRVIVHPEASLYAEPSTSSGVVRNRIKPFSVFYVYARQGEGDGQWLEVGASTNGEVLGWLPGNKASQWNQALTLVYTDRTGRMPVLFFDDYDSLEATARAESPEAEMRRLMAEFEAMRGGAMDWDEEFPVLAHEQVDEAVPRDLFYIMPIFEVTEPAESVKFLQVASINPGERPPEVVGALKTGIVFVIDTTISMGPYIERTREVVRTIYDEIEDKGLEDKVGFGLVGFRSSTEARPGVEYTSRVYSDIRDATEREAFEQALASMREASVSTHTFN